MIDAQVISCDLFITHILLLIILDSCRWLAGWILIMLDDADAADGDSRLSEASRKGSTKSENKHLLIISLTKFYIIL